MGIPNQLTCLLQNLYAGQEATVRMDMEQKTGSKSGKEYIKAVYGHPVYLTYIQNTSYEMLSWMNHKLESKLLGEISTTSGMQNDTTLMAESEEELKSLDAGERGE